jgi:uncharacterized protein (TIGR03067 family)
MKTSIGAGFLLLCWATAWGVTSWAAEPATTPTPLQGTWHAKWVEANGERKPSDGNAAQAIRFTAENIETGNEIELSYTLDTTTDPKVIDIVVNPQTNPVKLEGIYKLEERQLTICLSAATDGVSKRPDSFSTSQGSTRIMILLERNP